MNEHEIEIRFDFAATEASSPSPYLLNVLDLKDPRLAQGTWIPIAEALRVWGQAST